MKLKAVLPIAVLTLAIFGAASLVYTSPRMKPSQPEPVAPAVRILDVKPAPLQMQVHSQGTVVPRTETELVPEVSGNVVWASPKLVSGGYFKSGESLLKIDDIDFRSTVSRARATISRANAENDHARFELQRAQQLDDKKLLSQADVETALRAARVAEAALIDAKEALQQAERDLARTDIKAPFTGLVRSEQVDIGQFVSRGSSVASLYAVDYVEVRLPIADQQLAYLNLPMTQRGELDEADSPKVKITATFAGADRLWEGRLVRTEAEIDTMSRMVNAVVRVKTNIDSDAIPLPVGLFVEAEIEGRKLKDIVVLPRSAVRNSNQVLVIDAEDRLQHRTVNILRIYKDEVFINSGLQPGERICISPLQTVVNGMQIKPMPDDLVEGTSGS